MAFGSVACQAGKASSVTRKRGTSFATFAACLPKVASVAQKYSRREKKNTNTAGKRMRSTTQERNHITTATDQRERCAPILSVAAQAAREHYESLAVLYRLFWGEHLH